MSFLKILFIILICLSINCFGDITSTNAFQVVEKYINKSDKNTLVIFDVDDVLLMPTDEFVANAPIRKN